MWGTEEMLRSGSSVYATVLVDMSYRERFSSCKVCRIWLVFFMCKDDLQQLRTTALTTN